MLNATDQNTFLALRELKYSLQLNKPLIIWVDAGASKWQGYDLWIDLAKNLRREFFQYVSCFDNDKALRLINANEFPLFFQLCRDLDQQRYYRFLSSAFLSKPETPLYQRFIESLSRITPLRILTTNVDEAIEQRFPDVNTYQRSDITGCLHQLNEGRSFILKLHGSRSAIESTVFTHVDYESLKQDTSFLGTIRHIFTLGTVLFIGYSVSDQYLIDLLSDNARDMSLFGAGPHFVVSSQFRPGLPLRQINYTVKRFPDHRSALTVLDIIHQLNSQSLSSSDSIKREKPPEPNPSFGARTAYFISDLLPPGTWTSSTTVELQDKHGIKSEMTVGLGFTNDEMPFGESTALHDFAVGLICFDSVYFPLSNAGRVQALLRLTTLERTA